MSVIGIGMSDRPPTLPLSPWLVVSDVLVLAWRNLIKFSRNVRLSEAPSYGKPVLLYEAISSGAKNYMQLAREFLDRQQPAPLHSQTTSENYVQS